MPNPIRQALVLVVCGITGFIDSRTTYSPLPVVEAMVDCIRHRGPDDADTWYHEESGVALGHTRLSIIDLSAAGRQPMTSADQRYVITYNGEIYNHAELRQELDRSGAIAGWRGHSDTETLLEGLAYWGLEHCLERLNGMFAFALWDRAERKLHLARDRLGEKPLYYGWCGSSFVFSSQVSSLRRHPNWRGTIDPDALAQFLRLGYIPAPLSIYGGIKKLPSAHFVTIHPGRETDPAPVPYWSLDEAVAEENRRDSISGAEAVSCLDSLLTDSVVRRMQADVPVGALLSGGIDSSVITALMQANSSSRVKTFTIGFGEAQFNEADHARAVAHHLDTDHSELYVDAKTALDVVPRLPMVWDEPFADPSQIPTLLVSELAKEKVKVVLSGDGGDELFYGYARYELAKHAWLLNRLLPDPTRSIASKLVRGASNHLTDSTIARKMVAHDSRSPGQRARKLSELIATTSRSTFYGEVISHVKAGSNLTTASTTPSDRLVRLESRYLKGLKEYMMWVDTHLYLPDDILVKLDRASMAVGLEARVPLLDHRVVEWAWSLPMSLKHRRGTTKWPLRNVLYRYVPQTLVDRPKMGFAVPIDSWLRGPLNEWAGSLLSHEELARHGLLEAEPIRRLWEDHLSRRAMNHYALWNILMFQAWHSSTRERAE